METEYSSLRIALKNGFPNASAFHREFKKYYHMVPSQYRSTHVKKNKRPEVTATDLLTYIHPSQLPENLTHMTVSADLNDLSKERKSYWFSLLNMGKISNVLKNGVLEQIEILQSELGFVQVRIILDDTFYEGRDYYDMDRIFDSMFEMKLNFLIVIDYRVSIAHQEFKKKFKSFLNHCINRYGDANVSHWDFELMYDSDFVGEKAKEYRIFFESIQYVFHDIGINVKLWGPSLLVDQSGDNLRRFLKANPKIEICSIRAVPFSLTYKNGEIFIHRSTNLDYVLEQYRTAEKIIKDLNMDCPLRVVSWKDKLNNIDALNDSCYSGAALLQTVFTGYRELTDLPLEMPLDSMYESHGTGQIFSGLPGVISASGIRKPSFTAYRFLKQTDSKLCYLNDHVMVTASNPQYIQIVMHNCRKLSYRYYMSETLNTDGTRLNECFEDLEPIQIEIQLNHMTPGRYVLKRRRVNEYHGNPYDAYLNLKYQEDSFVGKYEMEYLEAASCPEISGESVFVGKDGALLLECDLQPNEIQHIHLIFQRER